MRIAIFGGSFDPIHIAHVAIVETALKQLDIDKLIIVPTYLNPFKNSFY
ncbi:MAG: adenylyltransferase/cytidyltransferase family protein, partial [Arcobacter sp.]|nr:adenylyltransferase/cytidyltransferase family protein [Arcobacter sp.]